MFSPGSDWSGMSRFKVCSIAARLEYACASSELAEPDGKEKLDADEGRGVMDEVAAADVDGSSRVEIGRSANEGIIMPSKLSSENSD